jgi:hypothetical protein
VDVKDNAQINIVNARETISVAIGRMQEQRYLICN